MEKNESGIGNNSIPCQVVLDALRTGIHVYVGTEVRTWNPWQFSLRYVNGKYRFVFRRDPSHYYYAEDYGKTWFKIGEEPPCSGHTRNSS